MRFNLELGAAICRSVCSIAVLFSSIRPASILLTRIRGDGTSGGDAPRAVENSGAGSADKDSSQLGMIIPIFLRGSKRRNSRPESKIACIFVIFPGTLSRTRKSLSTRNTIMIFGASLSTSMSSITTYTRGRKISVATVISTKFLLKIKSSLGFSSPINPRCGCRFGNAYGHAQ